MAGSLSTLCLSVNDVRKEDGPHHSQNSDGKSHSARSLANEMDPGAFLMESCLTSAAAFATPNREKEK